MKVPGNVVPRLSTDMVEFIVPSTQYRLYEMHMCCQVTAEEEISPHSNNVGVIVTEVVALTSAYQATLIGSRLTSHTCVGYLNSKQHVQKSQLGQKPC